MSTPSIVVQPNEQTLFILARLEDLPDELLTEIFRFVFQPSRPWALANLWETRNRASNTFAQSFGSLYLNRHLGFIASRARYQTISVIGSSQPQLVLSHLFGRPKARAQCTSLAWAATLKTNDNMIWILVTLLKHMSNLEQLFVSISDPDPDDEWFEGWDNFDQLTMAVKPLTRLTELTMSLSGWQSPESLSNLCVPLNVRIFNLSLFAGDDQQWGLVPASLHQTLMAQCPPLHCLSVDCSAFEDDNDVIAILAASESSLRHVWLDGIFYGTFFETICNTLQPLLRQLLSLRIFEISDYVSDDLPLLSRPTKISCPSH